MRKNLINLIIILLIIGCNESNKNESPEEEPRAINNLENDTKEIEETIEMVEPVLWKRAEVTHNHLNMREKPELNATIIHSLKKGTLLTVLDRTDIEMEINGKNNYWYQVEIDSAYSKKGWVFGSFINEFISSQENTSYFKDHLFIDPSLFPDERMKIFGIEPPYSLPENGELADYDSLNSTIFFLINSKDETPRSIRVEAIEPDGDVYYQNYNQEFMNKLKVIDFNEWTQEELDVPYLGFRFFNTAAFYPGKWTFNITTDKNQEYTYDVNIRNDNVMFCSIENPDPFNFNSWASVNPGERLFLFGDTLYSGNTSVHIVIYYISDEQYEDLSFRLIPKLATDITVDEDGRFVTELVIGKDFPYGQYKVAYGIDELKLVEMGAGFTYYE